MPKRKVNATSVTVPEKLYGYNGYVLRVNLSNGEYNKAKKFYYTLIGWVVNGVPLPEKVEELGIE